MSRNVRFKGQDYALEPGETVLDGLLRHGLPMPHSCLMAACETCLLRAVSGKVADEFTEGLPDSLREQGYFYACICVPEEDLEVELSE